MDLIFDELFRRTVQDSFFIALGFVSVLLNFRRFYGDFDARLLLWPVFLLFESPIQQSYQLFRKEGYDTSEPI